MSPQGNIETAKESPAQSEHVDVQEEKDLHNSDVLVNADLMHDAFDGENREHEMGVWEAVQTYPWACFWAFIMCFTIVSAAARPAKRLVRCPEELGTCGKDLG